MRLTRLIRYAHRHAQAIAYKPLKLLVCLIAVGDSAHQAPAKGSEAVNPLAMRGYVLGLALYHDVAPARSDSSA